MILIELDRPRHLKYDGNALSDADQKMEYHLCKTLAEGKVIFGTARILLWAGLKHEDQTLTLEQAGLLMDVWISKGNTLIDLATKITEGLKECGYFDLLPGDGEKNLPKSSRSGKK